MEKVKTRSRKGAASVEQPAGRGKDESERQFVCVKFCQVRLNGQIVSFDRGEKLTVAEGVVYPAACFREQENEGEKGSL